MVEITLNDTTPSQAIIKAANANFSVTDARGRVIAVRRLKTLDRMRLFELVGAVNSKNDEYLGYATLAYSVTMIDGAPLSTPTTKLALEALVQQLDDDGFAAVAESLIKESKDVGGAIDGVDAIKNG